ncbi:MAG: glutamine-hydrolyzing GMP synthase [Chitinivibrionales bacterium]|nr:glutamine-hydrolyzing GMP synthase [Chitinivibrionales bacterium]
MDTIVIVDFGSQYTHLIANRIRRLGVFTHIVTPDQPVEDLKRYKGIILSGGPKSVLEEGSPTIAAEVFTFSIPILGLCYGHQLIGKLLGGRLSKGSRREYGKAQLSVSQSIGVLENITGEQQIWMSHGDAVEEVPAGFTICGSTEDCSIAAMADVQRAIFGLQFHPEVTDTICGMTILNSFIQRCGCLREWTTDHFYGQLIENIVRRCEGKKVFLLVSGGVDSTVLFALLNEALGTDRVVGLHIDNGLMRRDESDHIDAYLRQHGFTNLHTFHGQRQFLSALHNVIEPEQKRTIIGNQFIAAQEQAHRKLQLNTDEWLLAQGTIYPDTIESAGTKHADRIKTHHNRVDVVLQLIEQGKVIEPLAQLYKDEVRQLGEKLNLPHSLLMRHPFPGPGLGVRLLCSDGSHHAPAEAVSRQVVVLSEQCGFQGRVLPVRSVGVQGDCRTYSHPVLLQGKKDWQRLEQASILLTNQVRAINRVVYSLTGAADSVYQIHAATITEKRLELLRAIDAEVTRILNETREYEKIWQMPVVLLPLVNQFGKECVVLRPIISQEAMTARFYPLSDLAIELICTAAAAIDGIGDLFIDITHKPPATIEWE